MNELRFQGKEKFRGGLMDLDLDSDEEITEVSTALTDYDDLSLNEGIDFGKMDDKYGPGNGDLKELISYKMSEVYRDISEYNTCESSANESNLAEKTAIEKSGETSGNKELLDSVEAGKDVSHVERGETDVGNTENENEDVGTADKGESGKKIDISKLKSEFGVNEQSEKIIEPVEGKKSENADKENKVKANEVPENWESLELDKDEVYMSPEVQFNLPDKSDKDSSVPDNPFNEELSSSAGAGKSSVSVDKTETDVAVTKTDSEVKSSVQSVQNVNESRVKPEMKTSVSVTASYPTSLTTTVSSTSSALLASSVNNSLSSAMSMLQSAGANVMAPPMLMTNMNPMLYQMVVGQLIKAYPALTANPDMLSNVALQQTSLLQHYIATGQISAANINEAFLQGAGDGTGKLGNLEQTGSGAETGSLAGLGPGTQMPAMASGVMSSSNNVASKTKDSTVKDINSVKGAINQTNESVNASKELGAVKCSDSSLKSDTVPQTKPVPYRPPGLRALVTSPSKTVFQSTVTNKTSNSVSEMSQNPFSAVKNLPVKPSANVTSTSSARPNPPNPNMNNSASGFGDLSKLVKPSANMTSTSSARPNPPNPNMNNSASGFGDFGKLVKPSADMTSASSARPNPPNPNMNNSASGFGDLNKLVKPSANVTNTSSARPNPPNPNANNSSSGFGDLSKPLRRPFKQYIPVSKSMDSITQPKDVVYDTIPNSSLASGADDFDEPLRPPSRTNISKPKSLPVSFSSVPEIKHVVSSHSLSMQGHKSANSNQSFIDSKPVVSQQSTEETSKHADFLPQYAKRHSPELREKVNEVQSRDFLPSFVKNISTEGNNLTENQQSFQGQLPPRFRRMSAPHHQSSTEDENWDDEIDPYAETKMMKINPKRELHMRSLSSRKPAPNEGKLDGSYFSKKFQTNHEFSALEEVFFLKNDLA